MTQNKAVERANKTDSSDCYNAPLLNKIFRFKIELALRQLKPRYKKILEIGFGNGIMLYDLSKRCDKLYGCDNQSDLDVVNSSIRKQGIKAELTNQDILDMSYKDKTFDAVICISVLEHIFDLEKAISEINRVSKEKADIIIGVPHTNFAMNGFLQFLMKKVEKADDNIEDRHVSSHKDIEKILRKRFFMVNKITVPFVYTIFKVIK